MSESQFYSIDRLVEFGMGMSIAQQMVRSMNSTMNSMHIPGVQNPMQQQQPLARVYYAVLEGKQAGPFSETELVRLIADKKVSKETYIITAVLLLVYILICYGITKALD